MSLLSDVVKVTVNVADTKITRTGFGTPQYRIPATYQELHDHCRCCTGFRYRH